MKLTRNTLLLGLSTFALTACNTTADPNSQISNDKTTATPSMAHPGDNQIPVPPNYKKWPVFLADVDRETTQQIRDIYINPLGHETKRGEDFPVGTQSVMEIWKAKVSANGSLLRTSSGRLIKDGLTTIVVMSKHTGVADSVAPAMRTGNWVYSGYEADGITQGGPTAAACRGCHMTQGATDWFFRYDEYFDKRDG